MNSRRSSFHLLPAETPPASRRDPLVSERSSRADAAAITNPPRNSRLKVAIVGSCLILGSSFGLKNPLAAYAFANACANFIDVSPELVVGTPSLMGGHHPSLGGLRCRSSK